MSTPPDTGTSLYYPYLEVNENYLKFSLLYWDCVRRIVPRGVEWQFRDSRGVQSAADHGVVRNTSPNAYLDGAAERFRAMIVPLFGSRARMRSSRFAREALRPLRHTQAVSLMHRGKMSGRLLQELDSGQLVPIHREKMSRHLRKELSRRRLSQCEHDWIAVPVNIGGIYMSCLAAEMGEAIRAPLITDVAAIAQGGEYILFGAPSRTREPTDPSGVLLRLGIRLPKPEALARVSMTRVLRFHRRYADERIAFREKIDEIVDTASTLKDPIALEDYLATNKRQIESALRDHRKLLGELGVKSFTAFLKVGCPTAITAAVSKAADLIDPRVISITGLAMAMVTWWADFQGKRRAAVKSCPWHYTFEVKRKFRV